MDALHLGKVSVGPPWFNTVFIPLMTPLVATVGVGALLNWKRDALKSHRVILLLLAVVSIVAGVGLTFLMSYFSFAACVALVLAVWVVATTLYGLMHRVRNKRQKLSALTHTPVSFWGMTIAHLGIAVFTVGVALVSVYNTEADLRMEAGDTYVIDDYAFTFRGVTSLRGPNYNAAEGDILVTRNGETVTTLTPQKRVYDVRRESMTEASIHGNLSRDLFAALGEPLEQNASGGNHVEGAWSVRLYHKPFIRLIWLGACLMALGGLLAALDKRYRRVAVKSRAPQTAGTGNRATHSTDPVLQRTAASTGASASAKGS